MSTENNDIKRWTRDGTLRHVAGIGEVLALGEIGCATILLTPYDASMAKADYIGARAYAKRERAKAANEPHARLLEAAARVAKALETRPAAMRKGAESLVGSEVRLRISTGTISGKLKEVTADKLVVATTYIINRQKREKPVDVPWKALTPEQQDELAEKGGWEVPAAERAIARGYAAFASGDLDATESAVKGAGGHPLAEYLKSRVEDARVEAAYTVAMDRARGRLAARNWKGAVESLEEALAAKPGDAEAKRLLAEAESHIGPSPTLTLDLGGVTMQFVYIRQGVFVMGGTENPKYGYQGVEKPKHEVSITRGFYIGKYEVTQAQYQAVMADNPSWWKEPNRPVEQVSWHQAVEFCRLATERTRRQFRLPSEAEWEYACRAGSTGRYSFGSDGTGLGDYAWCTSNSGDHTRPVGQKKPNAWGLFDIHGNVWEWVADWYDANYYANGPREDPAGPQTGRLRLLRGGAYRELDYSCRAAFRDCFAPSRRNPCWGFRAAVSVSPPGR